MLKGIRNSIILTSLLYIVLGVVLIVFPEVSLGLACILIGAVTLIYGVVRIVAFVRDGGEASGRFDLFVGVLLAALGIFLLVCPQVIVSLIPIALGIYIIVDSVSAVKKALEAVDGVASAEVSHTSGTAVVTLSKPVDSAVLKKAVEDKDYKVTSIEG